MHTAAPPSDPYAEIRAIVRRTLGHTAPGSLLQTTAIVHEAWIRMAATGRQDHAAMVASVARSVIIDEARRQGRSKRGGDWRRIPLEPPHNSQETCADPRTIDVLDLEDALAALERHAPRCARVVELRFFGGLTVPEAAQALGVSDRTVEDDWRLARAWLRSRLEPIAT